MMIEWRGPGRESGTSAGTSHAILGSAHGQPLIAAAILSLSVKFSVTSVSYWTTF
jgi:hypothetical protein